VLVGSHTWQNFQSIALLMKGAESDPPPEFDHEHYLETLAQYGDNFFRQWR